MKALVSNFQKDSRKNFSHRRRRPEAFGKKLRTVCFQPQKEKKNYKTVLPTALSAKNYTGSLLQVSYWCRPYCKASWLSHTQNKTSDYSDRRDRNSI